MANASAGPSKFNLRNPSVKRIMQEIKEMREANTTEFIAEALEDDIFEWHFIIRGPPDTEFEGGIYHGRILLPPEYPFKPPGFMMLTPNGRFQTGVKVCLSISSHHPEHWQPSWSVRTALTALVAFMPTPGQGALGSLDFTKEERSQLAAKSVADVPRFGSAARQQVINEMHERMLALQRAAAASEPEEAAAALAHGEGGERQQQQLVQEQAQEQEQRRQQHPPLPAPLLPQRQQSQDATPAAGAAGVDQDAAKQQLQHPLQPQGAKPQQHDTDSGGDRADQQRPDQQPRAAAPGPAAAQPAKAGAPAAAAAAPAAAPRQQLAPAPAPPRGAAVAAGSLPGELPGDRGLTFLAVVLSVAIAAMLLKKVITAFGAPYRLVV